MCSLQTFKRSILAWGWLCFTCLIVGASPVTYGETAGTDGNLTPSDSTGTASCWLNKGGPFYLLSLASNEKIHWSDTVFCGARLQVPDGWNVKPLISGTEDYGELPTFVYWDYYSRISGVSLRCKVIQGNVKVDFKGYAAPVNPGQPAVGDYQFYFQTDVDGNSTQYIYWRYNAPTLPQLTRKAFNGTATGGQDCAVPIDLALPETLDVQFTSLNSDPKQDPQDCIVAFYLDLTVDQFHMRDYMLNADGTIDTDNQFNSYAGVADKNNRIGERATILYGHGVPGLTDLGNDPSEKLGDFGKKLYGLRDYLGFDSISKEFGGSGDNSALFSVTALELPGIKVMAGNNSVETPRIGLVDDFTWDQSHLNAMGLGEALRVFRILILFVFAYYSVLRFWRAFNH